MRRFGCFSVTGYGIPAREGEYAVDRKKDGLPRGTPITTWYVTDDAYCGEIVYEAPYEHLARTEALRLNGLDRQWDKEVERGLVAASNGHV